MCNATICQFKYTYVMNMIKYFQDCAARLLWRNFVSISINIILLLFCCVFKANVLLMLYILFFFFNLWFSFLISCLVSADVLYVWSAYLKDDLPFSFRMKCWFLCCFTCGKEAIMVIFFVFVLYLCFMYMYIRIASKCCECSWKSNDSMNAC